MLHLKNIDDLSSILHKNNEKLSPLTKEELKYIESLNLIDLPKFYKDFLMKMGKGAGNFMKGSSVFYDEIIDLKEWSIELLRENEFKNLPENSFVFWMHQGYQLSFFILGESDNPNVYSFSEIEEMSDFKLEGSLIDFFEKQLDTLGNTPAGARMSE
jgi:hypothetical protein